MYYGDNRLPLPRSTEPHDIGLVRGSTLARIASFGMVPHENGTTTVPLTLLGFVFYDQLLSIGHHMKAGPRLFL